jgi:hypothetical protein
VRLTEFLNLFNLWTTWITLSTLQNNGVLWYNRMREFLKWSSPCGDCEHQLVDHIETGSYIGTIDANNIPLKFKSEFCGCGRCKCKEWVPKDNLDRIEFLAEKRKLITKEK